MIRVLAGQYKGQKLLTPEGLGVRPTSERLRAAFFNIINSRAASRQFAEDDFAHMRFFDVFCGTGAMGIEAASRGFEQIIWVDRDVSMTRANLTKIGITPSASFMLHQGDATRPPPLPPNLPPVSTNIAYFDPPYDQGLLLPSLKAWCASEWFAGMGLMGAEASKREAQTMCDWAGEAQNIGLRLLEPRQYGRAHLILWEKLR